MMGAGGLDLHGTVPFLSPAQVATAIQEHIGNLTYYFIHSADLPLLDPLRMIPILGDPLADVLQPFLRPIVDLGYGSPFAIPGIIPSLSPFTFAGSLGQGAAFGIARPLVDGLPSASLPIASGF
jgi:PE-PPE domain